MTQTQTDMNLEEDKTRLEFLIEGLDKRVTSLEQRQRTHESCCAKSNAIPRADLAENEGAFKEGTDQQHFAFNAAAGPSIQENCPENVNNQTESLISDLLQLQKSTEDNLNVIMQAEFKDTRSATDAVEIAGLMTKAFMLLKIMSNREHEAQEQAAREEATREQEAREKEAREQKAWEEATREQEAREQEAREQLVPLYRYLNKKRGNHFYTTNSGELEGKNHDYKAEGVAGHIYATQVEGSSPFYRHHCLDSKNDREDNYYTTAGRSPDHYDFKGVQGYVFESPVTGSVAFLRYYNARIGDHFYTTNPEKEVLNEYVYEGVAAYILP